jgi:hypothetical protein
MEMFGEGERGDCPAGALLFKGLDSISTLFFLCVEGGIGKVISWGVGRK